MSDHFRLKQENSEMEDQEIKKEPQDLKDLSDMLEPDIENDDFKEENEQFINKTGIDNTELEEDKPLKRKKHKKKSKRKNSEYYDVPEPPASLVENYYDLDLSVEFLSQLFKYVDELCEYINNGDLNINRSSVVVQNLNYAVSCYRVTLPAPAQSIKDADHDDQEDFKYDLEPPEFFENVENEGDDSIKGRKNSKAIFFFVLTTIFYTW